VRAARPRLWKRLEQLTILVKRIMLRMMRSLVGLLWARLTTILLDSVLDHSFNALRRGLDRFIVCIASSTRVTVCFDAFFHHTLLCLFISAKIVMIADIDEVLV
jgi:hypothetical protein